MVFANSTDRIGTNRNDRITASSSETIVNSSEVDKNEKKVGNELITISVRNASLKETVLGICRSYGISVIGVESLKGSITATVKGESPEAIINELGKLYHFSVSKEHNTLLIDSDDEKWYIANADISTTLFLNVETDNNKFSVECSGEGKIDDDLITISFTTDDDIEQMQELDKIYKELPRELQVYLESLISDLYYEHLKDTEVESDTYISTLQLFNSVIVKLSIIPF